MIGSTSKHMMQMEASTIPVVLIIPSHKVNARSFFLDHRDSVGRKKKEEEEEEKKKV